MKFTYVLAYGKMMELKIYLKVKIAIKKNRTL
jgi:hypothetical protein